MFSKELEELIAAALEDGVVTAKERQTLIKRAMADGLDVAEFEMILDSRIAKLRPSKNAENIGSLKKCPQCGTILNATETRCHACGLEFSNKKASISARQLADKLEKLQEKQERINVIKDFPVPVTAEDLLDFLTAMSSKAKQEDDKDEKAAYLAKYQEAKSKAEIFFPQDIRFKVAIKKTRISWWNRLTSAKIESHIWRFVKWSVVFFVLLLFIAIIVEIIYEMIECRLN